MLDEKKLGYDPSGMDFFNYGQYLIMCGSNRRITLYNREGNFDYIFPIKFQKKNSEEQKRRKNVLEVSV